MPSPYYQPDLQEELEQTQQTQLSTQQYSEPEVEQADHDAHLWGFLLPCSPRLSQVDFWRQHPSYTIGRGHDNAIRLPGMRISAFLLPRRRQLTHTHKRCIIRWDGNDPSSPVVVKDLSTSGIFVR